MTAGSSDSRRFDDSWLRQRWSELQQLVSENYGAGRLLRTAADLPWLERILNERLIWPEQIELLEALAVAYGEMLIAETADLQWSPCGRDEPRRLLLSRKRDGAVVCDLRRQIVQPLQDDRPLELAKLYDDLILALQSTAPVNPDCVESDQSEPE